MYFDDNDTATPEILASIAALPPAARAYLTHLIGLTLGECNKELGKEWTDAEIAAWTANPNRGDPDNQDYGTAPPGASWIGDEWRSIRTAITP